MPRTTAIISIWLVIEEHSWGSIFFPYIIRGMWCICSESSHSFSCWTRPWSDKRTNKVLSNHLVVRAISKNFLIDQSAYSTAWNLIKSDFGAKYWGNSYGSWFEIVIMAVNEGSCFANCSDILGTTYSKSLSSQTPHVIVAMLSG